MKSFILALILLLSAIVFVGLNGYGTVNRIDSMLDLASTLPQTELEFQHTDINIAETVKLLTDLWDKSFPLISFTAGYENTDRCDEAIGALSVHFQNKNTADFTVALSEFCDGLNRLRILESLRWESIF